MVKMEFQHYFSTLWYNKRLEKNLTKKSVVHYWLFLCGLVLGANPKKECKKLHQYLSL
jgi:hypothetical protein